MNLFELVYERFYFDKSKPIRLFEAFAGIGTQHIALKNIGCKVEIVGISEIDKYAIKSYEAIHGQVKNYGGIGSFDRFPKDIDILTWSFPCQDISLAGKQKGLVDGSRSNYGYVFLDTVKATPYSERPKVLIMENVPALISEKFQSDYGEIHKRLEEMGYQSYSGLLNAKDYGVAQNRERIFVVSILGDYSYTFPKPFKLEKRLLDYLEENVDEKYFLSDKMINYISQAGTNNFKVDTKINLDVARPLTTEHSKRAGTTNYISPDLPETFDLKYLVIPEKTKKGYAIAELGDGVYIDRPHQKRGVVQKGMIPTIKTQRNDIGVIIDDYFKGSREPRVYKGVAPTIVTSGTKYKTIETKPHLRIRKLTPRETWRLMGIDDAYFDKVKDIMSNAQLYKQAGNAIVVNVLEAIFNEMIR